VTRYIAISDTVNCAIVKSDGIRLQQLPHATPAEKELLQMLHISYSGVITCTWPLSVDDNQIAAIHTRCRANTLHRMQFKEQRTNITEYSSMQFIQQWTYQRHEM
jgi:hypothetical protein